MCATETLSAHLPAVNDFNASADRQYIVLEADVKPVNDTSAGDIYFGASQASGSWTHSVCRFGMANNGFFSGTGDSTSFISTEHTNTNGNWYHLKLVLDTSNYKYYVSVDGTVLNPDGYQSASTTPEWFSLGAGNAGQNTAYYELHASLQVRPFRAYAYP